MCGVIGMFSKAPKESDCEDVVELFKQSRVRGLHAFGFTAVTADGPWLTNKAASSEENTANLRNAFHLWGGVRALIGHTRYSTSGDYKTPENNQPVLVQDLSLVFNGVISMKTREEYSREYGKQYETENDGEIFARRVLDGEEWEAFVREGAFSFAGCFLHKGELWALRNTNRPLWFWKTEDRLLFASTKDIFRRAFPNMLGNAFKPLPAGKAYSAEELLR